MTGLGSFPERQEFCRSEAKPPRRFWDRAGAPLMTVYGWEDDVDRFMRLCDMVPMNDRLFMLLMEGVAGSAPAYRPGARHALMIFATGPDMEAAQSKALEFVSSKGWTLVEPRRAKEVGGDIETIADDTLRSAAETALALGSALIIYQDEIRPDA